MIVYKATSKTSGKSYIGKTIFLLEKRKTVHLNRHKKGSNCHFHRAIRKYGVNDFEWEIIEDNIQDESSLNEREIYWIRKLDVFNNGYNMTKGGEGASGLVFSEEHKRKISNANKGKFSWKKGKNYLKKPKEK